MSANASNTTSAKPTAGVNTQANEEKGLPKKIVNAQTVCNEKNEKGKLCNGHLKQLHSGGEEAEKHLRGDDILFKCQTCGTLYMGPPLGHVRDPDKQRRFVERELAALLQASGGTLPAIVKNERGVFVLAEEKAHAPAAAKPAATPAAPAKAAPEKKAAPTATTSAPVSAKPAAATAEASESKMPRGYVPPPAPGPVPGETQEQKLERLRAIVAEAKRRKAAAEAGEPIEATPASTTTPAAASTSGTDSSAQADAHRPSAEAQAATGQASAAPLSSAAATASPAAHEEAATAASNLRRGADGLNRAEFDTGPVAGETQEQKIARLRLVVNAARERAGKPPKY